MAKDPKNNVLRIRLTEEQRAKLDKAADGQGTSTWARAKLLALATDKARRQ